MQFISPFKKLFPQQQQQTLNCLCVSLFHINWNDFFLLFDQAACYQIENGFLTSSASDEDLS